MKETSARLLRLLTLLQTRREWSGTELADRLGVTTRTIRRDVGKLRDLDYPVFASMGTSGGGYRLGSGAQLPPLLLDDEEAVAVAISLRTATGSSVSGIGETALRALLKVEQVLPSRLRNRVAALDITTVPNTGSGPTVDLETLTAIATACRDRQRLRFSYASHGGSPSDRDVEPHQLVTWGRRWYLVAWDVGRDGWRTFRVDRVRPQVPVGPRFTPRSVPGGDAAEFVARSVAQRWPAQATVLVQVAADSPEMRGWLSYGRVEPVSASSCHLHVGGETLQDIVFMLGSLTVDFTAVEPPSLGAALVEAAERLRRAGS
ncbi:WYL domain-containing protein [Lentzea tibetensis]|uniref:WYL domain-containing protein n=1 Tax=Lentzea tibetensis TaxID=2591470 RepID=A0A563EVY0_9PSEU|nr:WYL domain-containing protein [Lentzea tibetensis]TWP51732.1 WYL domain-containing protein [Lentzea tibetensis]